MKPTRKFLGELRNIAHGSFMNTSGKMQFTEALALKAVSILLALILWITILSLKAEEKKILVRLEPLLPPGMVVVNKIPQSIQFTLSGPRVWVKETEKKIQPIRPDLRKTRDTTIGFAVSEDLLGELPVGVKVLSYYPAQILIRLDEIVERYISVKPTLSGSPHPGYEVTGVKMSPSKVAVKGPKGILEGLEFIGTETFQIEDLQGTKEASLTVEVDTEQGLQLSRETQVKVKVLTHKVNTEDSGGFR